MRSGDLLRRLDQRLLPHLVGAANRLAQGPAQRGILLAAVLLSCLAVTVTAMWGIGAPQVSAPTADGVTRVGVAAGESIPGYLQDATDDLEALRASPSPENDTFALVSLATYLTPHQADSVLGDVPVAAVIGRVPLPERQTEVVRIDAPGLPDDVITAMADLAARKDREAGDYRARAVAVSDGGPEQREQRALYLSAAQMAEAEATAYRGGCACVYAAVVRAEPVELRQVASQPDVRVVDPAPEVRQLDRTVFTPPLPEQDAVAHPLADLDLTTPDPVIPDPAVPDPVVPDPVVPDPAVPAPVTPTSVAPDPVPPTPDSPDPGTSGSPTPTPSEEPAPDPLPEVRKSPSTSSSSTYSAGESPTPTTSTNAVRTGTPEPVSEGEVGPVGGGSV